MLRAVVIVCALALPSFAHAEEYVYRGGWLTTNRRLSGDITCVVTPLAKHEWQGRFHGTWQGVDFDYSVRFHGPAKQLTGIALIDGASYEWKGWINSEEFKASFGGDRYQGSFEFKRQPAQTAAKGSHREARKR
ncbi:MAG TPA: hypothetical protein VGJ16_07340 [Pirellulales bacterium]|jgi:hypothetical protein